MADPRFIFIPRPGGGGGGGGVEVILAVPQAGFIVVDSGIDLAPPPGVFVVYCIKIDWSWVSEDPFQDWGNSGSASGIGSLLFDASGGTPDTRFVEGTFALIDTPTLQNPNGRISTMTAAAPGGQFPIAADGSLSVRANDPVGGGAGNVVITATVSVSDPQYLQAALPS